MLKSNFSTDDAAHLAGFKTPMMVDYLCRSGIVVPTARSRPGRGRPRLYSFGDVVVLRAISRLLSTGLPVVRLKVALRRLQRDFRGLSSETVIKRYLITDGRDVFLEEEPGALVNLNREGQMAFAFIVDVGHARDDVVKVANLNPARFMKVEKLQKA